VRRGNFGAYPVPGPYQWFPGNPNKLLKYLAACTLKDSITFRQRPSAALQSQPRSDVEFKDRLKANYNQPAQGNLFDMATGQRLLYSTVTGAHIFQKDWHAILPGCSQFGIEDINDVRNGLLLYKPVEVAFDQGKICIEVDGVGRMRFALLDQSIRDKKLVDLACEL
jgi:hypothetical protein